MTQNQENDEKKGFWTTYGMFIAALLVLAGLLLPPVKRWLNAIPYLWHIVYPILSVFVGYELIWEIRRKDSIITIATWAIFLVSSLAMTAGVFGLGAPFYAVGKVSAVVFIVLEMGTFLYDSLSA